MIMKAEDIQNVAHDAQTRPKKHLVKLKVKNYYPFSRKEYVVDPLTIVATEDKSAIIAGKEAHLIKLKNIKSVSVVPV